MNDTDPGQLNDKKRIVQDIMRYVNGDLVQKLRKFFARYGIAEPEPE